MQQNARLEKIKAISKRLSDEKIDGWLYVATSQNKGLLELLLGEELHLTRRAFIWVSSQVNQCFILAHSIEAHLYADLGMRIETYVTWNELKDKVESLLATCLCIALDITDYGLNSFQTDAGTYKWIENLGVKIVSSEKIVVPIFQLTREQLLAHVRNAHDLSVCLKNTWDFIARQVKNQVAVADHLIEQFLLNQLQAYRLESDYCPIIAIGERSANPHYAKQQQPCELKEGDWILIDVWAKTHDKNSIYADLCQVGVCAAEPTERQQKIFDIVYNAQSLGIDQLHKGEITGQELDTIIRGYLCKNGYEPYLKHRSGHSLDGSVHGVGVNIDGYERPDFRKLIKGSCFTIEPGLYFDGEFGVRLEQNIMVSRSGNVYETGFRPSKIICVGYESRQDQEMQEAFLEYENAIGRIICELE